MQGRLTFLIILLIITGVLAGFFIWNRQNPHLVAQLLSDREANIPGGRGGGQTAFLLSAGETNYLPIRDFNIEEPIIGALAAGVYDVNSGRFLFAKNINERRPIASITKLMSAVIILETLDLGDTFTIAVENTNVDGTGADIYSGERIVGRDLFKIMLIKSSNDAAVTFASEAQKQGIDLVGEMNRRALALGMFNTKFADPAGLQDNESFSTVADLVKLISSIADGSLIWQTLRLPSADVASIDGVYKHHLINTNRLLGQLPNLIGGKTGFTDKALGTMALKLGVNNGKDALVSLVLGSQDRFGDSVKLIEWTKRAYSWE